MMRKLGMFLGFVLLGLSLVSFVVPVLPTVPLLIATCWVFSKTSPRWHAWILNHKQFGRPLQLWENHGVIEMRVKVMTTVIMSACLFYPVFLSHLAPPARLWMAVCALAVFAFLWTRPRTPIQGELVSERAN